MAAATRLESKKKSLHATEREQERVELLRQQFAECVRDLHPDRLVFVDESGCNTSMTPIYARSPRGQRVGGKRPYRYKNVTILGALTLDGLKTLMTIDAATDADVFRAFVQHLLVPALRPGDVVIMDNLSSHKVSGVREAIEAAGARLLYLPPYSPEFNPIELAWSKLKQLLRATEARTRDAIDAAVSNASDSITASDAHGWFRHCGYHPQPL